MNFFEFVGCNDTNGSNLNGLLDAFGFCLLICFNSCANIFFGVGFFAIRESEAIGDSSIEAKARNVFEGSSSYVTDSSRRLTLNRNVCNGNLPSIIVASAVVENATVVTEAD